MPREPPGDLREVAARWKEQFCYTFKLNFATLASREPPGALREAWAVLASPALSRRALLELFHIEIWVKMGLNWAYIEFIYAFCLAVLCKKT